MYAARINLEIRHTTLYGLYINSIETQIFIKTSLSIAYNSIHNYDNYGFSETYISIQVHVDDYSCSFVAKVVWKKKYFFKIFVFFYKIYIICRKKIILCGKKVLCWKNFLPKKKFFTEKNINKSVKNIYLISEIYLNIYIFKSFLNKCSFWKKVFFDLKNHIC